MKTLHEYLASLAPKKKAALNQVRVMVKQMYPNSEETFSYGMIGFKEAKMFLYVGAFSNHIGIYPPVTVSKETIRLTRQWRNVKGNLLFPLDQPIPFPMIRKVAEALHKQYHLTEVKP